ncbi:cupin domain-containing protein [Candidatus Auribacterota bacterium]
MDPVKEIIERLGLRPHPKEGGYFKEIYRSDEVIAKISLPDRYDGPRPFSTSIYYLITPDSFSSIHRLCSDEIFHFYIGDPVEMLQLKPDGSGEIVIIGNDMNKGTMPQVIVPKGVWQGSRLVKGGKYALLGTTVSPGFDLNDYEDGNGDDLIKAYPDFKDMIIALTPK